MRHGWKNGCPWRFQPFLRESDVVRDWSSASGMVSARGLTGSEIKRNWVRVTLVMPSKWTPLKSRAFWNRRLGGKGIWGGVRGTKQGSLSDPNRPHNDLMCFSCQAQLLCVTSAAVLSREQRMAIPAKTISPVYLMLSCLCSKCGIASPSSLGDFQGAVDTFRVASFSISFWFPHFDVLILDIHLFSH